MSEYTVRDMAETTVIGLGEDDRVESVEILEEVSTNEKVVVAIEMDTGETFFVEIISA